MASDIFINYRRDDSHGTAGRLYDQLVRDPRSSEVFMDVDRIPAGMDFVDYLNDQVARCDVLLAVIGPNWLQAKDGAGQRRLDNPADYVRVEIAAALARKIRVVPVLVDGARVPQVDELPDDLKPLVRRNAFELRNAQFGRDANALADNILEDRRPNRPAKRRWIARTAGAAALLVLLAGWIGLYRIGLPVPWPWAPPSAATLAKADALLLVNAKSSKCLAIGDGRTNNSAPAAFVDCGSDPSSRWRFDEQFNVINLMWKMLTGDGTYQIFNVGTELCLTIWGGETSQNNIPAVQYACDDDKSRSWTISDLGAGVYRIKNVRTGRCLGISDRDRPEYNLHVGEPVEYKCDTDPSRRWAIKSTE